MSQSVADERGESMNWMIMSRGTFDSSETYVVQRIPLFARDSRDLREKRGESEVIIASRACRARLACLAHNYE
jgi:hypothetical protein